MSAGRGEEEGQRPKRAHTELTRRLRVPRRNNFSFSGAGTDAEAWHGREEEGQQRKEKGVGKRRGEILVLNTRM